MAEEIENIQIEGETPQPQESKLKKLHNVLVSDEVFSQITPVDYNDFVKKYQDEEKFKKLHNLLSNDEVFSQIVPKDLGEAISKYELPITLKKKEPSQVISEDISVSTPKSDLEVQSISENKPSPLDLIGKPFAGQPQGLLDKSLQTTPTDRQKNFQELSALKNKYIEVQKEVKKDSEERQRKEEFIQKADADIAALTKKYETQPLSLNEKKDLYLLKKEREDAKKELDLIGVKGSERAAKIEAENTPYIVDLSRSLKSGSAQLLANISASPALLYDIASYPQNKIVSAIGRPDLEVSSSGVAQTLGLGENQTEQAWLKEAEDARAKNAAKYDRSFLEYAEKGDYNNALKSFGLGIAESLPATLTIMAGGIGGATGLQTTLGGGVVFGADKKRQLDENPLTQNMDEATKTEIALSSGLLEGIFEAEFGLGKLGRYVGKLIAPGGEKIVKDEAQKLAKESFIKAYAPVFRRYFGTSTEEGLSESATEFANNLIDKYYGVDPNKDLSEGLIDAFLLGMGSGKLLASPVTIYEISTTAKVRKEAKDLIKKRESLSADLQNPNIPDNAKAPIAEALKKVNEEEGDMYQRERSVLETAPQETRDAVVDLNRKIAESEDLIDNPQYNLSEDTKDAITAQMQEYQSQMDEILGSLKEVSQDVKQIKSESDEVKSERRVEDALSNQGEVIPSEGKQEEVIAGGVTAPAIEQTPPALRDVESTAKALEGIDTKEAGVIDYNAKRLSLEEREKEDKPIIKDNTPLGTLAKNDMGDAYELQLVNLEDLTPKETGQKLDLVEKYINWKKEGNDFPPITAIRKSDGTLIIVDGHNRYRAAKLNGDKNIRVWVGLNEGNSPKSIDKAISEAYHTAKAKPESTRTEQEQELVKAVESLLSKEQPIESANAEATTKESTVKGTPIVFNNDMLINEYGNIPKEFIDKINEYKESDNKKKLEETYSIIKVVLNGTAQRFGENTTNQFKALKKDLEDYANRVTLQQEEVKLKEQEYESNIRAKKTSPSEDSDFFEEYPFGIPSDEKAPFGEDVISEWKANSELNKAKLTLRQKANELIPSYPIDAVYQFFVLGGKVHSDAIQELLGKKESAYGKKNINKEIGGRLSKINKKTGFRIEKTAEIIWGNQSEEFQNMHDLMDVREAVEEVLLDNPSIREMIKSLANSYDWEKDADRRMKEAEDAYYGIVAGDEFGIDEIAQADEWWDSLSDDEKYNLVTDANFINNYFSEEELLTQKQEEYAVQKSETEGVDVRKQAENGERVGEGNAQKQEAAQESKEKEIAQPIELTFNNIPSEVEEIMKKISEKGKNKFKEKTKVDDLIRERAEVSNIKEAPKSLEDVQDLISKLEKNGILKKECD
jgi:hypothetical protein